MVKQDKKKSILRVNIQFFYWEYEKEKETGQKSLTFQDGDLNPGFLNKFPSKIRILREIRSIELTVLKKSRLYQAEVNKFLIQHRSPVAANESKKALTVTKSYVNHRTWLYFQRANLST